MEPDENSLEELGRLSFEELKQRTVEITNRRDEKHQNNLAKLEEAASVSDNPMIDRLREVLNEEESFRQSKNLRFRQATNDGRFDESNEWASFSDTERKVYLEQVNRMTTLIDQLSALDDEARISLVALKQGVKDITTVDTDERSAALAAFLDKYESLQSNYRSATLTLLDRIEEQSDVTRKRLLERTAASPQAVDKPKSRGWKRWAH